MKSKKIDFISIGFLIVAVFFAFIVRVLGQLGNTFPLNDGGLFYSMIRDLQVEHFSLPVFTSYNGDIIPYAYPPLAFYIVGFLSTAFRWSVLSLVQWLPAIISLLSIFSFYLLAQDILKSKKQGALATLIFSFIPTSFMWLIMGGGVTRSLGYLFALLAIWQLYHFYALEKKNIGFVIILSTLVVLTHPEASVHVFIVAVFFFLYFKPTTKKSIQTLFVAFFVLFLSSPWWITVVSRHGFSPFTAALLSSQQDNVNLFERFFLFFKFSFTGEPNLTLIGVLGLLGIITLFNQKKYFIPIWFAYTFFLEPRSASVYLVVLLAMTSAVFLEEIIFPVFQKTSRNFKNSPFPSPQNWAEKMLNSKASLLIFTFLFLYGTFSAFTVVWQVKEMWTLSSEERESFQWIEQKTSPESQFLVLTSAQAMLDPVSEWFPAITERVSLATVFGFEWLSDRRFGQRIEEYQKLQLCLDEGDECLDNWAENNSVEYTHVYLTKKHSFLALDLEASSKYKKIYQSENLQVFEKKIP